ncbi:unnamed protein product [Kuraishia capsulata CBS 1993]|uniref:Protein kinase domain-containing protein n=1 Tax=Kuraishia capsulata CBS 1993 TaxID=1382522 RepID=W6MH85_9ASCO|nr:uncharacterized protein KUCA_T00001544001 [Kuraishia capsulata CBS 1993]CDK25574.1 unnamed protein product [Kuraishia capsulata CBS 1993]
MASEDITLKSVTTLGSSTEREKKPLVRTYSESESANFHDITGVRLYDDFKYRPSKSLHYNENRSSGGQTPTGEENDASGLRFSKSHTNGSGYDGMQDEYVPGLNFAASISKWFQDEEEEHLFDFNDLTYSRTDVEKVTDSLNTSPRDSRANSASSVLTGEAALINKLHNQVHPIHVPKRSPRANLSSFERTGQSSSSPERKFDRGILDAIPANFYDLSFSERKKLVADLIPLEAANENYREHLGKLIKSKFRKKSVSSKATSPAFRMSHASVSLDFETKPDNINDKGSVVMGYRLGNIIGFGAWGIIRDCLPVDKSLPSRDASHQSSYVESHPASFAPTRRSSLAVSYNSNGEITNTAVNASIQNQIKAMKIINVSSPEIRSRFCAEIEMWSLLHHPNILPLLNWKQANNTIFALTTKIHGGTLFELVRFWGEIDSKCATILLETRITETKKYCIDVLQALSYMHSLGIVHGDVKLENCLMDRYLDSENQEKIKIVLCDFGMARFYDSADPSALSPLRQPVNKSSSFSNFKSVDHHEDRKEDLSNSLNIAHDRSSHTSLQRLMQNKRAVQNNDPIGISSIDRWYGPSPSSLTLARRPYAPVSSEATTAEPEGLITTATIGSNAPSKTAKEEPIQPDSHIGSLPYAAPETLKPTPPQLDYKTDMWAFGVMVYTMITGNLPFQHQYEPRLRAMILSGRYDVDLMRNVLQSEKSQFLSAIESCLDINPEKRLTAQQFLKLLQA